MLVASVLGLNYHRLLADNVDQQETEMLKSNYDYSFIVSYGGFDDADYDVVQKKSVIIDLSGGVDKVISAFSSSCRNQVHKTDRIAGLQFHSAYDDFDAFYEFYSRCERERNWYPVPPEELKNSLVFFARWEGELISGISC